MSITLRTRKSGNQVYEIRIYRGIDPETGKQLPPYTTVFHIPEGLTQEQAELEAKLAEDAFREKCDAGEIVVKKEMRKELSRPGKITENSLYRDYMRYYLKQFAPNHAPGTVLSYRQVLERSLPTFGKFKMKEITPAMLKQYISSLQTESHLKHSTCNRHFTVLRLFFLCALEDGIIDASPMAGLKRPRKPKDERGSVQKSDKAFTEEEVAYLLDCMNNEPLQWRALLTFMLDSGCRRGEAAGLRWGDIDLTTGKVTVRNTLQYTKEIGVYETSTKSGRNREIFLNTHALEILREWKKESHVGYFGGAADYCFTNSDGSGMNPNIITGYFRKLSRRYHLPHFHPHLLRHTMATLSILNGADVVSISQKLGHASVTTTLNVYSHVNEEAQRRASQILGDVIYNKGNRNK